MFCSGGWTEFVAICAIRPHGRRRETGAGLAYSMLRVRSEWGQELDRDRDRGNGNVAYNN